MKKLLRWFGTLLILALVGGGVYWGYCKYVKKTSVTRFTTEPVTRSELSSTISATGTVEPEELVNVGSQVNGKIISFGIDSEKKEVDYGSPVKEGMVLARIDDALYDAEMREAQAQKLQAQAAILSSQANIDYAKAKLILADSNWVRAQNLYPKGAMAKSDYDSYKAEYESAKATVAINEAALAENKAALAVAEASYDKANRNLGYGTISSPVDGVIIDRRVSIGQTVVSNMSASSLFLIAKDLKRMQVWVSVNEADIGSLKVGMPVEFTVDAFPDAIFYGEVHKIRLNATMSQNVVTYVVEVATDNSSGKLLPYLTASVKFIKERKKDVLCVPNAALRYRPAENLVPEQYRAQAAEGSTLRSGKDRMLWVRSGDSIRPVKVSTGLNDGVMTEIVSGDIREGEEVVVGTTVISSEQVASSGGNAGSPFLPKPPQRKGRKR